MGKREDKRAEIVDRLSAHFLEAGLEDISLRRLAEVAGTSDRMLLYYFSNKDDLVTAVLMRIGADLDAVLTEEFGTAPMAPDRLLRKLWALVKSDVFAGQLRLWLELSGRAARGDPLFMAISRAISAGWVDRVTSLLDVPKKDRRALGILIMSAVDGQVVLFPTEPEQGNSAVAKFAEFLRAYRRGID